MRGHDPAKHILSVFGGAGGQHACALADILKMRKIYIHKFSGILSAYGMGLAEVVQEKEQPLTACLQEVSLDSLLKEKFESMKESNEASLKDQKL